MSGSSLDAFRQPVDVKDFAWRALLTNQLGPLREIFAAGSPGHVPVPANVATPVAMCRNKDRPQLITLQIEPGFAAMACFFGPGAGTNAANGFAFSFIVAPTFRQLMFPSDQLYILSPVPSQLMVWQTTL